MTISLVQIPCDHWEFMDNESPCSLQKLDKELDEEFVRDEL